MAHGTLDYGSDDESSDAPLTSEERAGWCVAFAKADVGGSWRLALSDYEALRAAWQRGAAFFDGTGTDGERLSIKLAAVVSVSEWTPAALAKRRAVEAEERERARSDRLLYGDE